MNFPFGPYKIVIIVHKHKKKVYVDKIFKEKRQKMIGKNYKEG